MVFVLIFIISFITRLEGTNNSNNNANNHYEWRPLMFYESSTLLKEVGSFKIDWKGIFEYARNGETVIVPYPELKKHLEEALQEMNEMNIKPQKIKDEINFTALYYAVKNTKKDDIINLLKQYNLELSANQALIVDHFFATPEYEQYLPYCLNKEKHHILKVCFDIFACKKYENTIKLMESFHKQIEYQKKLNQPKTKNNEEKTNFPWIDKDTPLFKLPFTENLRYCASYLTNNQREIDDDKKRITEIKKKEKPQEYTALKTFLLEIGATIKKMEKKVKTQSKLIKKLEAIAAQGTKNTALMEDHSLDTVDDYPEHIKKTNKKVEENIRLIKELTSTIEKSLALNIKYIENHYLDPFSKLKPTQELFVQTCKNFFSNETECKIEKLIFEEKDASEVIIEFLIKERLYLGTLSQKFINRKTSKSVDDKNICLEYQSALESHRENVDKSLNQKKIKELCYINILNVWKNEIDKIFNKDL